MKILTTKSIYYPILACILCISIGCSNSPNWLQGVYVYDDAATSKALEASKNKNDGLAGIMGGLGSIALISQVTDIELTVTNTEIISDKYGTGKVTQYEIHKKPTPDSVIIKTSDGDLQTIERYQDGIAVQFTGASAVIYFKRK